MLPTYGVRCRIKVLPSNEGICPGCRKEVLFAAEVAEEVGESECPEFHAKMAPRAVLCIACGYHLKHKGFLSTAIERQLDFSDEEVSSPMFTSAEPVELNPYASPSSPNEKTEASNTRLDAFVADLTPFAVKRAERIVTSAEGVYWNLILSYVTCIGAFIVGPLYGYFLLDWYVLYRTYSELRNPTVRRSDHYGLALDFQASKSRIWIGFIGGMIALILVSGVMLLNVLTSSPRR
ncbi:MAG: hypothetical protein ACKVP0_21255 [Pirellulaceae bacterium]